MRVRIILTLTTLFLAFVTVAAWSSPVVAQPLSRPYPAREGSVTGRISSIGDASFSVDVSTSRDQVTVDFLIDDQTQIEGGRLRVGSTATVDYRTNGDNNIARHIVVRSAIHQR
jgi:hypothetical protein